MEMVLETPAAANLDINVLSIVFSGAVQSGLLERNLCREVARHPQVPRDRYVADSELAAFRRCCPPRTNAYIDLKMATGARQGQLAQTRWTDWSGTALLIRAAKHGRDTWYEGPGIRSALTECAAVFHGMSLAAAARSNTTIVVNRRGKSYVAAKCMIASLWHPAMKRFVDAGGERFREHDLRAKVASDSPDVHVAQRRLGHQTTAITQRVYMRAPRRVESASAHVGQRRQFDLFDQSLGGSAAEHCRVVIHPPLQGVPTKTLRGDR